MEVTFLKNHLSFIAGQTTSVPEERATYWIKTGVVTPAGAVDNETIDNNLSKKLKSTKKKK